MAFSCSTSTYAVMDLFGAHLTCEISNGDQLKPRLRTCCVVVAIILCGGSLLALVSVVQNQAFFSHKFRSGIQAAQTSFSWLSSLDSEADRKKLRVVFCSYVTSEIPYLLEWIEFHRLQGVDKFVFYRDVLPSDPEATTFSMQLELLPAFYRDAETRALNSNTNQGGQNFGDSGLNGVGDDLIEILPIDTLVPDVGDSYKSTDHLSPQRRIMMEPVIASSCLQRYRHKAEYVMHLDVDEFVYSPQHETMWDFLQSKKERKGWTSRILEKPVGFHIPSINFGSSGVFWDFHNFLKADYILATVLAYYDPRDSSLFRFLQHLNSTSSVEQPREFSPSEFAEQLIAFRSSRLKEVPFFKDIPELAEYVHQRLLLDFPPSGSFQSFVDTLPIPRFRSSNPQSGDPALSALGDYFVSVLSQVEQKPPASVEDVGLLDRLGRAELHRHYVQHSALFYPLVIEEQISTEYSDEFHGSLEKPKVEELFSECRIPNADRKSFLIEKEGFEPDSVALQRALDTYDAVCKGGLGVDFTQLGRTMYATSALNGNPRIRGSTHLRVCHPLDLGACFSRQFGGQIVLADANRDLRLDHHQFRSYERRSFGLPEWRGGPLGYPYGANNTIAQQTIGSVIDTSKLRFVPKLRERLSRLRSFPKMCDYVWNSVDENDQITKFWISRHNITTRCSAIELLGEEQVMCPSKYPYVGYVPPYTSVWSRMNPYTWCSDKPAPTDPNPAKEIIDIYTLHPNEETTERFVVFQEHSVFCPGFGVLPCCDYDPMLQMYQSPEFKNRHPKMWGDVMTDTEWKFWN